MFERDYLIRLIAELGAAIRRSMSRATEDKDPEDAASMLEAAVGTAVDMDAETLLSLAPESISTILSVSGVDPRVTEYMARSLLLAARYREEAGDQATAALRRGQALAIAQAWGYQLSEEDGEALAMEAFLADQEAAGVFGEDEGF